MARVFITGSSDGLGRMAAQRLVAEGHAVVVHARNAARAKDTIATVRGAECAVIGDLALREEVLQVAYQVNALGRFDAVIHNAAVGDREPARIATPEGLAHVFAINTLAPYLLTILIKRPTRLVYLSSSLHFSGDDSLKDLNWEQRRWDTKQAYCDSKLHDALLAAAVARLWPDVRANSVDPGWVPTRMGGASAPDNLEAGAVTQAWLAVGDDPAAATTGAYFYHQKKRTPHPSVADVAIQERLLEQCAHFTGIEFFRQVKE